MIHSTANVDPKAELDSSVEVGAFCVVGPNVKIGAGTKLLNHVVVDGWTEIGENNIFYPHTVAGMIPQDLKYAGEKVRLVVGNHNTFREMVTLNMGTSQGGGVTRVGDHNLFMAYVHLGHDCIVGNHCILANYAGLSGHVILEDFVNLGGMVGVTQYCRVGAHAFVTGQSGIERDIPRFSVASGSRPQRIRGANIVGLRRHGFEPQVISTINEAIKLWTREEVPKDQCVADLESQYGDVQEVRDFISFIKDSKNGVVK